MAEWDAEILEDRPNQFIAWQSLENSDVENSGSVEFRPAPGNRGTIVTVELNYNLPGGVIGNTLAKVFREDPGVLAMEALRCFKQIMEVGEVIVSDGTIWDDGFLTQRPAQPAESEEINEGPAVSLKTHSSLKVRWRLDPERKFYSLIRRCTFVGATRPLARAPMQRSPGASPPMTITF